MTTTNARDRFRPPQTKVAGQHLAVILRPEVKDALRRTAGSEGRSMSEVAAQLITEALQAMGE